MPEYIQLGGQLIGIVDLAEGYHALSVKLTDGIDTTTGAANTIDYPHHEIHGGSGYYITHAGTIADGADMEIRFGTPDTEKWPHWTLNVSSTGQTDLDLYEATSLTHAAGNALTPINRNRNSDNTSGMTVCHTPAGSGDGTKIAGVIWGLSTGTGATVRIAGGAADSRGELILKQATPYLIRILSGTDGNRVSVVMDWYEHTNR